MKRSVRNISVLLLCLLVLTPTALASPPSSLADGKITIQGTVKSSGGTALEDAVVTVSSAMQIPGDMYHTETAITNASGFYKVEIPYYDAVGGDVPWPHTGYIKVKAKGYQTQEIWPTTPWQKDQTHTYNFSMNSASSPIKAWAGLRNSYYGARWPDIPDKEFDYPPVGQWIDAAKRMSGYFSGSTEPTLLLLVGEVKTEGGPGSGIKLWFENPFPSTVFDKIEFVPQDGLNIHDFLGHCDSNGVSVLLQVESGHADIETLIGIVMGEFWWHPSVRGFVVDVEWYNNSVEGQPGEPVDDDRALAWERQVKSTWKPDIQLGLKHWDADWMPPKEYRGDIIFINDSQGFGSLTKCASEMGVWANEFAPNDVWFQQGYEADYDWWKNLTKPIPKTYGNALFNKGYNGQKVGFLWVDFTMRVVFDDIFPSEPPAQGDPWKAGVWYNVGDLVTYNGSTWKCVYAHTSYSHWYPGAPGLWFWQKQ